MTYRETYVCSFLYFNLHSDGHSAVLLSGFVDAYFVFRGSYSFSIHYYLTGALLFLDLNLGILRKVMLKQNIETFCRMKEEYV